MKTLFSLLTASFCIVEFLLIPGVSAQTPPTPPTCGGGNSFLGTFTITNKSTYPLYISWAGTYATFPMMLYPESQKSFVINSSAYAYFCIAPHSNQWFVGLQIGTTSLGMTNYILQMGTRNLITNPISCAGNPGFTIGGKNQNNAPIALSSCTASNNYEVTAVIVNAS